MPVDTVALCLAYLGATLGVAMVVPQLLRTVRHPRLEGVSPVAWGLTAVACLTWLTYGVRTATVPQIPGNVLLVSGAVAIVLLVPSQTSRRRRALVLGGAALAIVLLAFSVPAPFVGYLALGVGLVSAWPQVFDSFARWRAGGESGVSITTWSIKVVSQTCWLVYAVVTTQTPVVISASVALTTALALVGLESSRRLAESRRSSSAGVLTAA